jgi:hypothetical protein
VEAGRLELSPKKTVKEHKFDRGMSREPVLKLQKTVMVAAVGAFVMGSNAGPTDRRAVGEKMETGARVGRARCRTVTVHAMMRSGGIRGIRRQTV